MLLRLEKCVVRSYRPEDDGSLARHANNRKVWLNLRDRFPHPYSIDDARTFLRNVLGQKPETIFAIEVAGEAAGGIGIRLNEDVERISAELGYWLGEEHWGRGIMTDVVRAVTAYAVREHGLTRVVAIPYAWNPASCRVLEKAGYVLEARLRRSAIKDGKIVDQLQYAYLVPE